MEDNNLNCWEFKKCGREPNGKNVFWFGVCPAATEHRADGIHDGMNGGRCCWVIKASHRQLGMFECCSGESVECHTCDFYAMIKDSKKLLLMA